jgi:hypothetical protein
MVLAFYAAPRFFLLRSQQLANGPYPEPNESVHILTHNFLSINFKNIFIYSRNPPLLGIRRFITETKKNPTGHYSANVQSNSYNLYPNLNDNANILRLYHLKLSIL